MINNNEIVLSDAQVELVNDESITTVNVIDQRLKYIEKNILRLKENVGYELIEIGKYLIEAKDLVKHGEWTNWLENNVGFTQRSAQNYMRLARTFDNWTGPNISEIDASKLFLLQEMDADDRIDFLKIHDVKSMSVREMKAKIGRKNKPSCAASEDGKCSENGIDAEDMSAVWNVFESNPDYEIHKVLVKDLKPIDRYEEFFGPRRGEDYIDYLNLIQFFYEISDGDKNAALYVIITKDMTVLDEQEIVRAFRDLGIEEINVRYAGMDPDNVKTGMTLEEMKIYESIRMHIGRGMNNGSIKLTDSMKRFRTEMLEKGVDVFEYIDEY